MSLDNFDETLPEKIISGINIAKFGKKCQKIEKIMEINILTLIFYISKIDI